MQVWSWGGSRPGAGRKRLGKHVPHRRRERFDRASPVHVTFRMARTVYNLRSQRSFNVLKRALRMASVRFETHIVHFAVLGNHIHLVVESADQRMLSRAMKGLGVRIAHGMNRMMRRRGQVIGDRHHTRVIHTFRSARNVVRYVRENHRKHYDAPGAWRIGVSTDAFSSWAKVIALPSPQTMLLTYAEGFA